MWKHANSWSSKATNLKTKKHTKRIKIHQINHKSQTMTFQTHWSKLLFPKRSSAKVHSLQILIIVTEKPKIQRRCWPRRSCAFWNSCNVQLTRFQPKAGPDGGDGGRGGNIVLVADYAVKELAHLPKHIKAENGGAGRAENCKGRNGSDQIFEVK